MLKIKIFTTKINNPYFNVNFAEWKCLQLERSNKLTEDPLMSKSNYSDILLKVI